MYASFNNFENLDCLCIYIYLCMYMEQIRAANKSVPSKLSIQQSVKPRVKYRRALLEISVKVSISFTNLIEILEYV